MSNLLTVDRRTTLKWLAASLAFSAHHGKVLAGTFQPTSSGYGTDPNLLNPKVTWDKVMTTDERARMAMLADLILPGNEQSPMPSALGVHDFIDEWISAPYPKHLVDRDIIRQGLGWLAKESVSRFGADFTAIGDADRHALMNSIVVPPNAQTPDEMKALYRFFKVIRALVVGAYYTSDIGMRDLGYQGNVALEAFPPATDEMLAIIDRECTALGV